MAPEDGGLCEDELARERTAMANERTLLAYIRTAMMLFATGVTLIYLARDNIRVVVIGFAGLAAAGLTMMFGIWRFHLLHKKLSRTWKRP